MDHKSLIYLLPYSLPFITGLVLFYISTKTNGKFSELLLNISASLVTIPIVILVYEKVLERLKLNANKELSEYVKMNFDRELLTVLDRISWILFNKKSNQKNIQNILSADQKTLENYLETTIVSVFWLSTDWNYIENQLTQLLSKELIYQNLSIQERNNFIQVIKKLRTFEHLLDPRYFMASGPLPDHYSLIRGDEVGFNTELKNRYLLLKKINDQLIVIAFNDIKTDKFKLDLLTPVKINAEGKRVIATAIADILLCINTWLDSRGSGFILDDRNFETRNLVK